MWRTTRCNLVKLVKIGKIPKLRGPQCLDQALTTHFWILMFVRVQMVCAPVFAQRFGQLPLKRDDKECLFPKGVLVEDAIPRGID